MKIAKFVVLLLVLFGLTACSGNEKEKVEKLTDKTADKITHAIKDPIAKARDATDELAKKYSHD